MESVMFPDMGRILGRLTALVTAHELKNTFCGCILLRHLGRARVTEKSFLGN